MKHYDVEHVRQLKAEEEKLRKQLGRSDPYWHIMPWFKRNDRSPVMPDMPDTERTHLSRKLSRLQERIRNATSSGRVEMRHRDEPLDGPPKGWVPEDRYLYLNNVLFDGQLPRCEISFDPMVGTLAKVERWTDGSYRIRLRNDYDWTLDELDGVLAHQMIHIEVATKEGRLHSHTAWLHNYGGFNERIAECQRRVKFAIPLNEMTHEPRKRKAK